MYTNRTEFLNLTAKEGQAADMYTFGVILYEILHVKKMVDMDDYIRTDISEQRRCSGRKSITLRRGGCLDTV